MRDHDELDAAAGVLTACLVGAAIYLLVFLILGVLT